jgi:ASC-1-like (ASCH) protein
MPEITLIPISDPWYTAIKTGKKVIAVKPNDPEWREIYPTNFIRFTLLGSTKVYDNFLTNVIDVRCYDNIQKLLEAETLEKVLPGIGPERANIIYSHIVGSVLAIEISVCTTRSEL